MKLTVLGLCGQSVFLEVDHFHVPGETIHEKVYIVNREEKVLIKLWQHPG